MANTNEPCKEMNETNQTEDPNPELNEEILELNEEENPEDELHRDLNQLRILSDELKNTREPSRVSLTTPIQNIIESINIAHSEITSLSEIGLEWESIKALVYPKRILKTWISQKPNCGANLQILEQDNL